MNRVIGAVLVYVTFGFNSATATTDFQQWMQQQNAGIKAEKNAFQEYKDKRDKEFTEFLKKNWIEVEAVKGKVRDEEPKPDVMPVAKPEPVIKKPEDKPVAVTVPEVTDIPEPKPSPKLPAYKKPQGKPATIDFFGQPLRFYYDSRMQRLLGAQMNKEIISSYWSSLSKTSYEGLIEQVRDHEAALQLNDWATAVMVYKISYNINRNRLKESALLSWFILSKMGYKARVAYDQSSVYLLMPSMQELFEVAYFTFNDKRYYAIDFTGRQQQPGQVYTYDGEYPDVSREFDMQVTSNVASNNKSASRQLSFEFDGKQYDVEVQYDQGRVRFLSGYPQLNLNLYFGSGVYHVTATPLQQQLAAHMDGMTEQQAVNFLLRFVQTSLEYETDDKQFGKENYLFPEETLFYPYSDCEDRAVLFAWLVRSLLNLEVVGLDYPGHVASAVHFSQPVSGDSVTHNGKKYIVTDPTYINANAGMTMPAFRKFTPKVISY